MPHVFILAFALVAVPPSHAQTGNPPGPGGATAGMSPVLPHLFRNFQAFSAAAEVDLGGTNNAETLVMPMRFYYLKGDMRTELDMRDVRGPSMDEGLVHTLRQIGMDRVITILQPGRRQTVVLYPKRKAYIAMPGPSGANASSSPSALTRITKLGEETVSGMTCVKSQVTFLEGPGRDVTVHIWEARRLREFPVQIEMKQADGVMIIRYHDIDFTAPDPDRFEIPDGYQKHDGVQSILEEATGELLAPIPKPRPSP